MPVLRRGTRIRHSGIRLGPVARQAGSLDLLIDGRHVWTFSGADAHRARGHSVSWPRELLNRLRGHGRFTVTVSETGRVLDERNMSFGPDEGPIDLADADGRPLTLNKWGRLTTAFATQEESDKARILRRTRELIDELDDLGYRPFIVGGTLLGAVREGDILAHDDDTDIAYLSECSHPVDLVLESYRLQRQLEARGHWVVRHSMAHMQVTYRTASGQVDHFIDIFVAFFKDGVFYEPIHVDTPDVSESDILPFSTQTLAGEPFPAPAAPDAWLAACYGENWRTPDPTFHFETPRATVRRFHTWFGSQSAHRQYWDDHYAAVPLDERPSTSVRRFAERLPEDSLVVEIGSGLGADARYLGELGHDVIACDYSWVAIARARAADASAHRADYRVVNLYDRRGLLELAVELRRTGRPVHVYSRETLDGVTNSGRINAALFARYVVRDGAFAYLVSQSSLASDYEYDRPETWHLEPALVDAVAREYGFEPEKVRDAREERATGMRHIQERVLTPRKGGH